jgi:hypothetical protein
LFAFITSCGLWEELDSLIEIANAKEGEHIRTRPKKNKIDNIRISDEVKEETKSN